MAKTLLQTVIHKQKKDTNPLLLSKASLWIAFIFLLCALSSCDKKGIDNAQSGSPQNGTPQNAASIPSGVDVGQIIERYRALDNSRDSAMKA